MTDWQPIETAPRIYQSKILGFCEGSVSEWVFDYLYDEDEEEEDYKYPWNPVSYSHHGCGCCSSSESQPTHWMPLPAPPNQP